MRTIALEEHFASRMFLDTIGMHVAGAGDIPTDQLADLGERRLREMDAGGIDMQVLGHTHFGDAKLDVEQQRVITVAANDQAAAAVAAHPDRFAAFAALPMSDPEAAVRELTRAVEELGFAGAMINGLTDGRFLDDPALFSVLDRAARLRVPIYLHPGFPPEAVVREYYSGPLPADAAFALSTTAWGWHSETGLHVLRMITAGVFDRLPELQLIIGHMGEMVPFMLDRIERWLTPCTRRAGLQRTVAETFRQNIFITTSGMFSVPPFQLALQTMGVDRVLFSVDYPYSEIAEARQFVDNLPLGRADLEKISHANAERLLRLPSR